MNILRKLLWKVLPPDEFTSTNLRNYYRTKYKVSVGMYSYGCFDHRRIYPGTTIGRYCSFSSSCRIINRNHISEYMSVTPYLYEKGIPGGLDRPIPQAACLIEDDVWIGHNAIVLPSATRIGRGSVIGAGAIVTNDVPPYSIVVGNPGRVLRMRFSEQRIAQLEELKWWEWNLEEFTEFAKSHPEIAYGKNNDPE